MDYQMNINSVGAIFIVAPVLGYALFTFFSIIHWAIYDLWSRFGGR